MSSKLSLFPRILRKPNTWKRAKSFHSPQNCNHRSIYTDLWFSPDLHFSQKSRQSPCQLSLNCLPKKLFFISTETHHFRTISCRHWAGIPCSCQSLASTHCVFAAAAAAKALQSCPTLCDPRDTSPLGSLVPGILQARTLEWVAISFSNA